jgi:ABC-2 type transport system permease protein
VTGLRLVLHQARYDLRTFLRNPAAVFFTAVLPIIFLVVFVTIFGNERLDAFRQLKMSTYYVPNILALAVISSTFVQIAISLTTLREAGVLKRLRGTPLPASVFIASRVVVAFVVSISLVILLSVFGRLAYDVRLPGRTLPAFLLALVVGAASFTALGLAVTRIIPSEQAAPPVTNAIVLPLYFISGTFFSVEEAPEWMQTIASAFPIRHFGEAMLEAFAPSGSGAGFRWGSLSVIAGWGVAGLLLAVRTFRWTPNEEH